MTNQDFTTTLSVGKTPDEVFNAVNDVRGWWSEQIDGSTDVLGAEFTYRYEDVHRSTMKNHRIHSRPQDRLAHIGQRLQFR